MMTKTISPTIDNHHTNVFCVLHEQARAFMAEHGIPYNGDFPETTGNQVEKLKFPKEDGKGIRKAWLKSCYPERQNGTQGLCVTFQIRDGVSERTTRTFWANDEKWDALSEQEKESLRKRKEDQRRISKKKAEDEKRLADELADKALDRFGKADSRPPEKASTYFEKKGLEPLIDKGNVAWECVTDWSNGIPEKKWVCLVALRNGGGELRAIQELWPDDNNHLKRNKNFVGKNGGCFYTLGKLENDKPIRVAEGVATAISLFKATHTTTVSAMNSGNLYKVVEELCKRYPPHNITICADNDHHRKEEGKGNPGIDAARKVAAEFGCKIAIPEFPAGQWFTGEGESKKANTDFDDLRQICGLDAVKEQVEAAELAKKSVVEDTQDMDAVAETIRSLQRNETGDAELFVSEFQNLYVWDPSEGKSGSWFRYEKGYWTLDNRKRRYKDFEAIADKYASTATKISEKTMVDELTKRAKALRTARRRSAVLETASAHLSLPAREDGTVMWDVTSGLLACKNGVVVNLKTGKIKQAEPGDYIRSYCPTEYNPEATCPKFIQFLHDIFLDRDELVNFLQRLLGYISLGYPKEEIIVILFGPEGRNGKGTLAQTLEYVLGDGIAHTFASEMLLLQKSPKSADAASPNLAQLAGCRLAIFSEINKGRKIDASQVKNLSGNDTISCRRLFSNVDLKIKPSHTIILQTNFLPRAPADDNALWERTVVVPFDAHFSKTPDPSNSHHKRVDEGLKKKLKEEAPGILRWLIDGASEYCRIGLNIPDVVKNQTKLYRRDSDAVAKFLEKRCEQDSAFTTPKQRMLTEIKEYAEENGIDVPTRNEITTQLRELFQEQHQNTGGVWKGVSIRPEGE